MLDSALTKKPARCQSRTNLHGEAFRFGRSPAITTSASHAQCAAAGIAFRSTPESRYSIAGDVGQRAT
jgi:hypothetical protein